MTFHHVMVHRVMRYMYIMFDYQDRRSDISMTSAILLYVMPTGIPSFMVTVLASILMYLCGSMIVYVYEINYV